MLLMVRVQVFVPLHAEDVVLLLPRFDPVDGSYKFAFSRNAAPVGADPANVMTMVFNVTDPALLAAKVNVARSSVVFFAREVLLPLADTVTIKALRSTVCVFATGELKLTADVAFDVLP
jgi:hypothetical protein